MTTSTSPPPGPVRITRPEELLSALPALLGFVPARSLVVVCMEGATATSVGLVMRLDLPEPTDVDTATTAALSEHVAMLCARQKAVAAMLVVVEDRPGDAAPPHPGLVTAVERSCEAVGTLVLDAYFVPRVVRGERWCGYPGGDAAEGVLPDPQSSHVSAAHVAQGRVIRGSREELEQLLRRDPPGDLLRRSDLIDATVDAAVASRELAGRRGARADLELVLAAVAQVGDGQVLLDEEIARLGVALSDHTVRDACFGLAVGEYAAPAEQLWLTLCRSLPDPERAEAAVLLAYSCYVRGEGPLAGVALQAALASLPGHRLATLLETALSGGMPPGAIRGLADSAGDLAAELAVTPVPFRPRGPGPG